MHESVRRSPCPVLVLRGHHDRICPEDWATELAAAAPRPADRAPRAVAVAGAHMIPLTHGHLVARELEGFGVLVAR